MPLCGRFVIPRLNDLVAELDVAGELVLFSDILEVLANLRARSIERGPIALCMCWWEFI